jgi:hypothetical protein
MILQLEDDASQELIPEEKLNDIRDQIAKLENEIADLYQGTEDTTGLYSMMEDAVDLCFRLKELAVVREEA